MGTKRRRSLLLADSQRQMQSAVERILGKDFKIIWVHSGEQVVETVERERPALLVLDVALRSMSGLDALRALRKKGALPKAIVCSMIRDAPVLEEALHLGACGYVYKARAPFELKAAVETALAGGKFISDEIAHGRSHAVSE